MTIGPILFVLMSLLLWTFRHVTWEGGFSCSLNKAILLSRTNLTVEEKGLSGVKRGSYQILMSNDTNIT